MVAFFDAASGCPDGWMAATEASGRFLVATNDTNAIGQRVGTPLGDQEDRTHVHSFSATAMLDTRNLAAADGDNDQAAQPGGVAADGTTAPATTGLPFTQLVVCKKP